jgi:hypothetical protein
LLFLAVDRAPDDQPTLISAQGRSGRVSPAQQNAIDAEDHAVEFVSTLCTPSTSPSPPGSLRTSPPTVYSAHLR